MAVARPRTSALAFVVATALLTGACSGSAAPTSSPTSPPSKPAAPTSAPAAAASPAVASSPAAASAPSPAASPAAAVPSPAVVGSPSASGPVAIPTPLPPKSGQLETVRLAVSIPALSFSPVYIAEALGYFGAQGVKVDSTQLQSGGVAQKALVGGSVDMVESTSTDLAPAVSQGINLIAIQDTANMTNEVCGRKDFFAAKGITESSSLKDKMAALKGAAIGITSPGSNSDRVIRWLVEKYGGLNPDTDTQIIQVGSVSADAQGLDQNRIQAYVSSPPTCEINTASGNGMVLVKPSDVPEFKTFVLEVLYTTKDWAQQHQAAAKGVATAISMGNNFALKHPDQAIAMMQKQFDKVDPKAVDQAMRLTVLPAIPPDGKMTQAGWEGTISVLTESHQLDKPVDAKEGVLWTNQYIGDASVP